MARQVIFLNPRVALGTWPGTFGGVFSSGINFARRARRMQTSACDPQQVR
jgi:hypothetical protein